MLRLHAAEVGSDTARCGKKIRTPRNPRWGILSCRPCLDGLVVDHNTLADEAGEMADRLNVILRAATPPTTTTGGLLVEEESRC